MEENKDSEGILRFIVSNYYQWNDKAIKDGDEIISESGKKEFRYYMTDTKYPFDNSMRLGMWDSIYEIEDMGEAADDISTHDHLYPFKDTEHFKVLRMISLHHLNGCKENDGTFNLGNFNIGDENKGSFNIGNWNTGSWNLGNNNEGSFNVGNWNTGFFNFGDYDEFRLFNKISPIKRSEFYIRYYKHLDRWIKGNPTIASVCKESKDYYERCLSWWNHMTDAGRKIVTDMPNFDKDIFKKVTGVDVKI